MAGDLISVEELARELRDRGFEGFSHADLVKYIDWSFQRILRRANWNFESTFDEVVVSPPVTGFGTTFMTGGVEDLKDLIRIVDITDPNERFVITPVHADTFYEKWSTNIAQSIAGEQGVPGEYFFSPEGFIFLLPPPATTRTYRVYHYEYLGAGTWDAGQFAFPAGWDEVLLLGAEIICNRRARQLEFAREAEIQFDSALADLLVEQNMKHPDLEERVDAPWSRVR